MRTALAYVRAIGWGPEADKNAVGGVMGVVVVLLCAGDWGFRCLEGVFGCTDTFLEGRACAVLLCRRRWLSFRSGCVCTVRVHVRRRAWGWM